MEKEIKDMNFEETMELLEKTVNELEKGSLSLDDSVKNYQIGIELSKHAKDLLNNAESKLIVKEV